VIGFDLHSLLHVVRVYILLQGRVEAGPVRALDPERVSGQKRFAEGHKLAVLAAGSVNVVYHLGQRRLAVQPYGRDLGNAHLQYI
jgi:hypothetical protein